LEAHNQPGAAHAKGIVDQRRQPRFKLEVPLKVSSRTCGSLKGHTVDISGSGISAILALEVPLDEVVELEFTLPFGLVIIYAMVRQRSAFRYGFQFVDSNVVNEAIQATCRELALEQSLLGETLNGS
jgi:hypothetical protein